MGINADVTICGAGIAGVSAAYHLAVKHGIRDIVLVDERPPLSLTSDKSTECYRNWWPGPGKAMVGLMNRSIDLLEGLAEESGNVFHLNRRGYLYVTGDASRIPQILEAAQEPPSLGAGPLRIHLGQPDDPPYIPAPTEGYQNLPEGADLFLGGDLIHGHFPYLGEAAAALHVRRAGWFSAQQLGAYLLAQARANGVRLLGGRVNKVLVVGNQVKSVVLSDGTSIDSGCFINAAGPFSKQVAAHLGVHLPVYNELHMKVALRDPLNVVPRHAPLLIWTDPQVLPWSAEEQNMLAEETSTRWLLKELTSGAHTRPEGGAESDIILMLWEYHVQVMEPVIPPPLDEQYPEIALRGLVVMLPRMRGYFDKIPRPTLDGGYYTRTLENRPLISPLPVRGAYVIGALSGFGMMAGCAAGELLSAHVAGSDLPDYAAAFSLERYRDPQYAKLLDSWGDTGQL
jgi:glycine/D-amino acid oxidase-like deaminating enzyme